jgi:hypothetical protein
MHRFCGDRVRRRPPVRLDAVFQTNSHGAKSTDGSKAEHRCKAARTLPHQRSPNKIATPHPASRTTSFANAITLGHRNVSDGGAVASRCIKPCCSNAFTSSFSFLKRSITPAIGSASRHAVHVRLSSDSPSSGSLYLFTTNSNRITPPLMSTPRRKSTKISEISGLSTCSRFGVCCCFDMSKCSNFAL